MVRVRFIIRELVFPLPLIIFIFAFCGPLFGATTFPVRPAWRVADYRELLTPEANHQLESKLAAIQTNTGREVIVVTIGSMKQYTTEDWPFEQFATQWFNHWKIGNSEKNQGILLLVSVDDRKVRLELGRGFAPEWNSRMATIIENRITPRFKQKDYAGGILAGVEALLGLEEELMPPAPPPAPLLKNRPNPQQRGPSFYLIYGNIVALAVILGIFGSAYNWRRYLPRNCPKCRVAMRRLDEKTDDSFLRTGEQVEESLQSVDYDVWWCRLCGEVDIKRYASLYSGVETCPECKFVTLLQRVDQVLLHPTTESEGRIIRHSLCRNCRYQTAVKMKIPRVIETASDSSSSNWDRGESSSSSSGGSDSGGSSSSESSSSSGGSSSGGGATGSW